MNKLALITRADNNCTYFKYTRPLLENYAKQCNADFIIFDHKPPFLTADKSFHYRILKAKELLNVYDRILFLDADMVINKDISNIFEIVPDDCIGTILEDIGSRASHRHEIIMKVNNRFGDYGWRRNYTNAGCYLISKCHNKIFDPSSFSEYWLGWGSVDAHFGWQAYKNNYNYYRLESEWNFMSMFAESWNQGNKDRFKAYIIHYAGMYNFPDKGGRSKDQIIKDDIIKIYGKLL